MMRRSILLASLITAWFTTGLVTAQEVDIAALRQEKVQATETFFNTSNDVKERLAAIQRMGYPDQKTFERLLKVATNSSENDLVRLAAMKRYRYDDHYIDAVLNIIADPTQSAMLASELIYDIARRTTFRLPAKVRQTLQAALRERLEDPRDAVRLAAYRSLVPSHDLVAIDRIVEGVRNGTPPTPMADAVELLDVDGPTRHVKTVQPLIDTKDPEVLAQVVRVLAVDPDSRPAVVKLVTTRQTARQVRVNALRALSREDQEYFSYGLELLLDRREDPDVRYAALKGAMARMNYQQVPSDQQIRFGRAVQNIANTAGGQVTSSGKDLGAEAKRLVAHLRKYFPVIRQTLTND